MMGMAALQTGMGKEVRQFTNFTSCRLAGFETLTSASLNTNFLYDGLRSSSVTLRESLPFTHLTCSPTTLSTVGESAMQPTQTPTQMPQQDPLPDLNTLTSNAFFPFPSAAGAASAEGAGACSNASRSSAPSYSSASVPIGCGQQMYSGDTSFLYPNFVNEMSSLTPPQSAQGHTEGFVAGVTTPPAMPMNSSTMSNKGGSMNDNTSTSLSQATSSGIATSSGQPNDAEVRSNLFVCGLPVSVRDKELLELFEKHGEIESAKVMLDIHTGRSRGIAFVKFKNVEHAENAVDALNGTTVNGHQITVRVANSRAAYLPGNPTNKTFVRNVPLTVSRTTLFEYFAQFGEVTDLSIKSDTAQGRHNPSGRSASTTEDGVDDKLNIVFITYSTKEAAAKAAEATHTKTPFKECNGVPLLAKVAEDTVRRMERLSRRQRPATGAEGTREVSTSSSSTNVASMSRFAAPSMGAALPTGMMMPPMMPMTGGFPPGTFVSVPTMGNTPDLTAPTMMPANVAGDHMTALRDASGNPIYAPAQPNPATATGGMAYAMPGNMAQPTPPLMPQAPQQSQQAMPMSGAAPGQLVYMQTPSGSMMPVMYGGAQPATASMLPTQQMNPYFVMMGGQPPSNQ
ncbi:RNA recognition motif family protein [Leishmania donovani]|uniref:RNA recognition motif family protein n=1 Tax=Leishmania donovani TaxID=5661 RepID=A0A504XFR2_LEIDO|nr:RNA recognition motif family protein [Leishmania donovani]